MTTRQYPPIAKVTLKDFGNFLKEQNVSMWEVTKTKEQDLSQDFTTEGYLEFIGYHYDVEENNIYLLHPEVESLKEIWDEINWDNFELLKFDDISNYIYNKKHDSHVFLKVTLSSDDASNSFFDELIKRDEE